MSYARLTEDRPELAKQLANRAAAHLMRGRPAEALLDCDEALAVRFPAHSADPTTSSNPRAVNFPVLGHESLFNNPLATQLH